MPFVRHLFSVHILQIILCMNSATGRPPCLNNSGGMLSLPGDLLFFISFMVISTSSTVGCSTSSLFWVPGYIYSTTCCSPLSSSWKCYIHRFRVSSLFDTRFSSSFLQMLVLGWKSSFLGYLAVDKVFLSAYSFGRFPSYPELCSHTFVSCSYVCVFLLFSVACIYL